MSNDQAKQTILVADDDELLRRSIERILNRNGYKVITAEDGQAALTVVAQRETTGIQIDAVITDTEMPKLGGVKLAKILQQQGVAPVIAMSGIDMGRAYEGLGIHRFISKPFSVLKLIEILEEALSASEATTDPIDAVAASTLDVE